MAIFIVLWPYLLTTKLRCLQKKNIGHTTAAAHTAALPAIRFSNKAEDFDGASFGAKWFKIMVLQLVTSS